ncbi:MAG: hypothetical protein IKD09_00545, partial [Lentisphaeria bacterium]|nr:hypothetical protein [Lentisphaeria bacterium]
AYYGEQEGWSCLMVVVATLVLTLPSLFLKSKNLTFYVREGFVSVALSWIFMSLVGAVPMWLCGDIPSFTDALFETVSGVTTTEDAKIISLAINRFISPTKFNDSPCHLAPASAAACSAVSTLIFALITLWTSKKIRSRATISAP